MIINCVYCLHFSTILIESHQTLTYCEMVAASHGTQLWNVPSAWGRDAISRKSLGYGYVNFHSSWDSTE